MGILIVYERRWTMQPEVEVEIAAPEHELEEQDEERTVVENDEVSE